MEDGDEPGRAAAPFRGRLRPPQTDLVLLRGRAAPLALAQRERQAADRERGGVAWAGAVGARPQAELLLDPGHDEAAATGGGGWEGWAGPRGGHCGGSPRPLLAAALRFRRLARPAGHRPGLPDTRRDRARD